MAQAEHSNTTRRAVLAGTVAATLAAPAVLMSAALPSAPAGHLAALLARAQALEAIAESDDEMASVLDLQDRVLHGEIRCDADAIAKLEAANLYVDCERADGATI